MGNLLTQVPQSRIHEKRVEEARELARRAINSKSLEITGPGGLVIRDILPLEDLDSGGDNGWTDFAGGGSQRQWVQDLNAGTNDAFNEVYEVDSANAAENKIIKIFGLQAPTGTWKTTEVRFLRGLGGTQGVKAWVNAEELEADDESTGILAEPVVYGVNENGSIEHFVLDAIDNLQFRYLGLVAEATGETISEPQNPLLSGGGGGGGQGGG